MSYRILIIFFLGALPALAAQVVKVGKTLRYLSVSHDTSSAWREGDRLCINRGGVALGCGKTVKVTQQVAIVELDEASDLIAAGDNVRRETSLFSSKHRQPTSETEIAEYQPIADKPRVILHNLSAGTTVGDGFYFPFLHFQRIIDSEFSLGLLPSYLSATSNAGTFNAMGALLTINYYRESFFRGLWVQLGGGAYFFSHKTSTVEESNTSPSILGTVGWRGNWDLGLNVGIALGAQYVKDPEFTSVNFTTSSLRILALFDLGFAF